MGVPRPIYAGAASSLTCLCSNVEGVGRPGTVVRSAIGRIGRDMGGGV